MLSPDAHVRRMTQPEEVAYATGMADAESAAFKPNAYHFNAEQKLAYERGYHNYAGEAHHD